MRARTHSCTHTHTHTRTHTHTNLGVAGLPQLPAFLELPILSIQVPQLWMLPPNTKPSGHRTPISMLKPEIDKSETNPSSNSNTKPPSHHTPISMPSHTYLHATTHLSPCHHTSILHDNMRNARDTNQAVYRSLSIFPLCFLPLISDATIWAGFVVFFPSLVWLAHFAQRCNWHNGRVCEITGLSVYHFSGLFSLKTFP